MHKLLILITICILILSASGCGKKKEITGKDGATMVLIPAGEFQMGNSCDIILADGRRHKDEEPVHMVYLDDFYIDKYEVTNAQYRKFMRATGYGEPMGNEWIPEKGSFLSGFRPWSDGNFSGDDQPVVCVSWEDAMAYAKWADKRLPTEAEWEKAARGGLAGKRYPWGDNITHHDANYVGKDDIDRWKYTAPVGSFAPNEYELYDIAGNVWEWCSDWYDSNYYSDSPAQNPKGPDLGNMRVLRGGSWDYSEIALRCSHRHRFDPAVRFNVVGFRCVK
jgi:sulfatase modifying factor 1